MIFTLGYDANGHLCIYTKLAYICITLNGWCLWPLGRSKQQRKLVLGVGAWAYGIAYSLNVKFAKFPCLENLLKSEII